MEEKKCCQAMHGWQVKKTYDINIPKATILELEHIKTGAKYMHIGTKSKENVFTVAFKTVPTDNTGVAHILEHTVLTGSEKYPIRDSFFAMLKRSLQTFMNAFTSMDWTAYPFASANKKDFYNLMSLYLDASFFPKIEKLSFLQEGWRYSFDDKDRLQYEGVVYNEMKGVMSSASRRMEELVFEALYKEAPYHYNTGGDPKNIPELTYEDFKAFHKKHYHPSNAYFFSYGNLSLSEHLQFINKNALDRFEKSEEKIKIKKEKRWTEPKEHKAYYPVEEGKEKEEGAQVALSWLACSVQDNLEVFSLEILEDILLSNEASPIRKALLDSGFGSDLCDASGYDAEPVDTNFTLGLKGVKKENIEKVKKLIIFFLDDLVKNGLDQDLIESVVSAVEMRKRNITNQPYPYGIQIFLDIMAPWLHGGQTEEALDFDNLFLKLKKKVKQKNYFEDLIKKYFLDNPHYVFLQLLPDEKLNKKLQEEEKINLIKKEEKMSSEEKEEVRKNSQSLLELQQSSGDLSCLPVLDIDDVDKEITKTISQKVNSNLQVYKKNVNKLVYLIEHFDTSKLKPEFLSLLPLFSYILTKMGTKNKNYESLAKEIDRLTGGFSLSEQAWKKYKNEGTAEFMTISTYGLEANGEKIINLIEEVINLFKFDDQERIKMLLINLEAKMQSSLISQGVQFAARKAMSPFSRVGSLTETWHGLDQLVFLSSLKKKGNIEEVQNNLINIGRYFATNASRNIAIIGGGENMVDIQKSLETLNINKDKKIIDYTIGKNLRFAYAVPSSVSFTAAAMSVPDLRHKDAGALMVLAKMLGRGYLHNEIREKRGAYGGYANYDHYQGLWWFGSYRDPHIVSTLKTFTTVKSYLQSKPFAKDEVVEAIIACSGDIDRPLSEAENAKNDFTRKLMGVSDKDRQNFKDNLLKVSQSDLSRVGEKYLKDSWQNYSTVIISSQEKIKETNKKLGEDGFDIELW